MAIMILPDLHYDQYLNDREKVASVLSDGYSEEILSVIFMCSVKTIECYYFDFCDVQN